MLPQGWLPSPSPWASPPAQVPGPSRRYPSLSHPEETWALVGVGKRGARLAPGPTTPGWCPVPAERKLRHIGEIRGPCLEACGTEVEENGGTTASRSLKEQMFGDEGARTKLPALPSQPRFSSSHTCAKRLLAPGSW